MKNTATLAEVARKAGVSRQTAGRILGSNAHKHKPETVERVQQIADELGYRPNLLAKSVVSGKTNSIGILLPRNNADDFFYQLTIGIQDVLAKTDVVPIVVYTSAEDSEKDQIHRLVDRRVDGILIVPEQAAVDSEHFQEIADRNIPVVTLNVRPNHLDQADFVSTEEIGGGRLAASHFIQNGHSQLCTILPDGTINNLGERGDGFKSQALEAGVSCETWIIPGWDYETNLAALTELLQKPDRPTAFFCISDIQAATLCKAAEQCGLKAPDDFSVIGFADLAFAQYLSPALTTIRQDGYDCGAKATRMLLERINGKNTPPEEVILPVTLIERDSVQTLK